jgi:hypothetical protein
MTSTLMNLATRHLRLAAQAHGLTPLETPPFLSLFVRSADVDSGDLSFEEIVKLSEELAAIETLHICGVDAFLRPDTAEICTQFIHHNGVATLHIGTNGRHIAQSVQHCERILANQTLEQLRIEFAVPDDAEPACSVAGYAALAQLQTRDARLVLSAHSVVSADSDLEEIDRLSHLLYAECPQLERHSLSVLRGVRENPGQRALDLPRYDALDRKLKSLWADRERNRWRRIVRPALAWTSAQTSELRQQVVPCKAGVLSAVVYANGDVGVCETVLSHPLLGNLREASFRELWRSPQAQKARAMIRTRQCACANEVYLSPSVTFQPAHLVRALVRAKVGPQL